MTNIPIRACMLLLCATVTGMAIADEGMRCGNKLIETGMTQAEVLQHCGEPTSKSTEQVPVRSGNQVSGTAAMHTWTYKSYSTTRVLKFDQDRLVSIQ
jgi:hypothetical protein